jgi:bifunctional non-homologous end joining protein LigD
MFQDVLPQPLRVRKAAFDHSDYLFELKLDGFRALAHVVQSRCRLISRNGHQFGSFSYLEKSIEKVASGPSVLDGEIVCLDEKGRPQFEELLFHRSTPCFFVFDVLICNGQDLRTAALTDRKQELRRLLSGVSKDAPIRYVDHVEKTGIALFERVCAMDLEGMVPKPKHAPHVTSREDSTWFKVKNPEYSQNKGREELFDKSKHGWYTCEAAVESMDAVQPEEISRS